MKASPEEHEHYIYRENESEGSSTIMNMSDTEENDEEEQALFNRITTWERVMSQLKAKMNEGASVCDWTHKQNDAIIKKYFKVRRKLLSPDELACQYFWHGEDTFYDEWVGSSDVRHLLSFLRLTTSVIDAKETDVFFRRGGHAANYVSQNVISQRIQRAVMDSAKFKDGKTLLDGVEEPSYRAMDGTTEQLALQDKKCNPDLIFAAQYSTSPYWGVVKAKRMAQDPTFKHFFKDPTKGIMKGREECPTENKADLPSVVDDECIPSKRRCVTYPEEDNEYGGGDDGDSYDSGGSTLPANVRDTVDIFFSQLFSEIISLDCHQPSHKNRRMGIGVVGFRIFFLAFYAKPGVCFAKIPETKGGKTEVHVTGPLCILDAKDREDIARILLQLAEGQTW